MLDGSDGADLTLFARDRRRIPRVPDGAEVVEADVFDREALEGAVRGKDVVFVGLGGAVDRQAEAVVAAMEKEQVSRLILVNAGGIFDEMPGEFGRWHTAMVGASMPGFRRASDLVEASGLDWTVLRPGWLSDKDEIDYEVTGRDEPFRGTTVSRKSVAALAARIIAEPTLYFRQNIGVDRPGTEGDRPVW